MRQRLAAGVALLLIATAAMLVFGVALERNAETGAESHEVTEVVGAEREDHHDESGEGPHSESDVHPGGAGAVEPASVKAIESPWVVAVGTIASVALAIAVWRRPTRPVIVIVAVFTIGALVFDVREIGHQASEGRVGLVVLAGVIVALRAATIAAAGYLYRTRTAVT